MRKPAARIRLKQGNGRPLLLVHGSGTDGSRWAPMLSIFAERFTVYAIDRRDHGGAVAGEGRAGYRIEEEFGDLAEMLGEIADDGAVAVGHSYGALCVLGAAAAGARLGGLVLYEPPLAASPDAFCPPGLLETMRHAVDRGDLDTAADAFAMTVLGMGEADIERRRRLGLWPGIAADVRITLRELENVRRYAMRASHFASCSRPTLLLVGERSPSEYHETARALSAVLPDSRIAVLEGQGHGAIDAAPELFARRVIEFAATCGPPHAG